MLLARNAGRPVPVASLVKLMTVRLALESGNLDRLVTVPVSVGTLPETKVGLRPGEQLPLRTLLQALMVRSANDAADTVAVALGGSEGGFAQEMNTEAQRLGLRQTRYVNSSGLDAPGQYSSAADVAKLAAADLALPGFPSLVDQSSVVVEGRSYTTVNPFLAYYAGATGIKTGFTSAAMFCLAASAVHGDHLLIAVVLGEPSWNAADADAAALLDWGFAQIAPNAQVSSATSQRARAASSNSGGPIAPQAPPGAAETTRQAPADSPASPSLPVRAPRGSVFPTPPLPAPPLASRPAAGPVVIAGTMAAPSGSALPWALAGAIVAVLALTLGLYFRRP